MHFVIIPINMRIFADENKKWKDLSSLQPRKKMLKHIFDFLPPLLCPYTDNYNH